MFEYLDKLSETITWPITFKAAANGGKVNEYKFHAEFRRLSAERNQEISKEANKRIKKIITSAKQDFEEGSDSTSDDNFLELNKSVLDEVLVSVGELDKSGNYVAADEERAALLLAQPGVIDAILVARGKVVAAEKAKN